MNCSSALGRSTSSTVPMIPSAAFLLAIWLAAAIAVHVSAADERCGRWLWPLDVAAKLNCDPNVTARFSTDFGRLTAAAPPAAVLYPSRAEDIAALVRFAYSLPRRSSFAIAARGRGHSVMGQALAPGGVIVDMASLSHGRRRRRRVEMRTDGGKRYVDVGAEQLWIDVLRATLKHGVAPRSWTDYLYLTVGGTLSNAGISGQAFRHGPQISNVYELDVVTGRGVMMTCSPEKNPQLFYGVLGGLGQLGIITRARVAVEPAPRRVRWVWLFYVDFATFASDQELCISVAEKGFDYVEGQLVVKGGLDNSTFFSEEDAGKISALAGEFDAVYFIEAALYYDLAATATLINKKLDLLLKKLSFVPGFAFTKDVSYLRFLNRVHYEETKLRSLGLWDVPHPWLNLFVPKSRIQDFDAGVFKRILNVDGDDPPGTVLISATNKSKWENVDKMTVAVPDEEVFYTVGLLQSAATMGERRRMDYQNEKILKFCDEEGIGAKQYLPHYAAAAEWRRHFGDKWPGFVRSKRRFDPKTLLSPGQRLFATPFY